MLRRMATADAPAGPRSDQEHVHFELPDPDGELAAVSLYQEVQRPRLGPDFERADGVWRLDFPRPDADRLEYLFGLEHHDGRDELIVDPTNPLRAPGPFGDKSVVEFDSYTPPAWLEAAEAPPEDELWLGRVDATSINRSLPTVLWSAPGSDPEEALPLLVVHDGPEYAELSGLLRYLRWLVLDDQLPPLRAALLQPVDRDEIYSASPRYSRSLVDDVLPALDERAPSTHPERPRVGLGASLGALAMLHVHRRSPAAFGGLFLQSGSYFRPRSDRHETSFRPFPRISRFVGQVLAEKDWHAPMPVTMTCGTVEENLGNNRTLKGALVGQGYDVQLIENRDGHNWVGWRDAFHPHLRDLLLRVWS
jgi:enterochelin esterase-like enzyme